MSASQQRKTDNRQGHHHCEGNELEELATGDERQNAETRAEEIVDQDNLPLTESHVEQPEMDMSPITFKWASALA